MPKIQPRILSGFMELLPEDQIEFNRMFDTIRGVYELFGFAPIETPAIELSEILLAKAGGETEKQIYRFKKGDKDLSLHFDLTVPLARYVAQHEGQLTFPFRRYQMQKVWRGERAGAGRFREFYQCDIDVIGSDSVLVDAEIPSVIFAVFRKLGFEKFTIKINNRKILTGFYESLGLGDKSVEVLRIVDKIEKIGADGVTAELTRIGLQNDQIKTLLDFISISGTTEEILVQLELLKIESEQFVLGVSELRQVTSAMLQLGIAQENFKIDLTIARGLDYYTGTVYETTLDEYPGVGSVCSGGRFDDLATYYTDTRLPGVGISIGLTRLFYKLKEVGFIKTGPRTTSKVVVLPMTDGCLSRALEVASTFRQNGVNTEVNFEGGKFAKQMRYADRLGIPYVAVIGGDELQSSSVTLKTMSTGNQQTLSVDKAIRILTQ